MGFALAFAKRAYKSKINLIIYSAASVLFLAGAIYMHVYRLLYPKASNIPLQNFNRQIVFLSFVLVGIAFLALLVYVLLKRKYAQKSLACYEIVITSILSLCTGIILLNVLPQIFQKATTFVFYGEDGFSTASLLRLIGYILGIGICFCLSLSIYKVCISFAKNYDVCVFLASAILLPIYAVRGITALARLGRLKTQGFVFEMVKIDSNQIHILIYILLGFCLLMMLIAFLKNLKVKGVFKSSAHRRLEKARMRSIRRWSISLICFIAFIPFTLSYLNYLDKKPPEAIKLDDYLISDNKIFIEIDTLADGKLHKYEFITPNKRQVHFLAVKKPAGAAYGLGLDACDICGTAGYFERGNDVVCKRCDVVMNKNTIGFKGGCNPIPFPYEIKDGQIIIETRELVALENKFR